MINPKIVVFDLDECTWFPEMASLQSKPEEKVMGTYEGKEMVVGLKTQEGKLVTICEGALEVLRQLMTAPEMKEVKIAFASSSPIPVYSYSCLENLEVQPGVPLSKICAAEQIGKKGGDSKYKHFENIKQDTGFDYSEMIFFDDCGHEDHVTMLNEKQGVIGEATPLGMTMDHLKSCLAKFDKERRQ